MQSTASRFAQFMLLGLVFVAMSLVYTTALAFAIKPLGRVLRHLRWLNRWKGKLVGAIFISLGLRVALQRQ